MNYYHNQYEELSFSYSKLSSSMVIGFKNIDFNLVLSFELSSVPVSSVCTIFGALYPDFSSD